MRLVIRLAIKADIIIFHERALDHLYPTSESRIIVLFKTTPPANQPKTKLKMLLKLTRTVTTFLENCIVAMYHDEKSNKTA